MCGRYTLTRQERLVEDLEASLGDTAQGDWWRPRFNVAPTQPAPVVILRDGCRSIEMMRWGLVPHWADKGGKPPLMINARVETVTDKPMFRDALARRRCLVPADGFFEWKREGAGKTAIKQPMYMHRRGKQVFAFAGLWARNKAGQRTLASGARNGASQRTLASGATAKIDAGDQLSFTIVTGAANDLVAPIHDRMPIVLDPSEYASWLDPALSAEDARALLRVAPIGDWIAEPVSPRVNSAKNDDPGCIELSASLGTGPAQGDLFAK